VGILESPRMNDTTKLSPSWEANLSKTM